MTVNERSDNEAVLYDDRLTERMHAALFDPGFDPDDASRVPEHERRTAIFNVACDAVDHFAREALLFVPQHRALIEAAASNGDEGARKLLGEFDNAAAMLAIAAPPPRRAARRSGPPVARLSLPHDVARPKRSEAEPL